MFSGPVKKLGLRAVMPGWPCIFVGLFSLARPTRLRSFWVSCDRWSLPLVRPSTPPSMCIHVRARHEIKPVRQSPQERVYSRWKSFSMLIIDMNPRGHAERHLRSDTYEQHFPAELTLASPPPPPGRGATRSFHPPSILPSSSPFWPFYADPATRELFPEQVSFYYFFVQVPSACASNRFFFARVPPQSPIKFFLWAFTLTRKRRRRFLPTDVVAGTEFARPFSAS